MVLSLGAWAIFASSGLAHALWPNVATGSSTVAVRSDSEWFERADRRGRFILDRSSNPNLLLDENASRPIEVYRSSASGGGEVWYTGSRRVVLRRNRTGGWTYFPSDRPDGVIAEPVGPAPSLSVSRASMADLRRAVDSFANDVSETMRRNITVEYSRQSAQDPAFLIETLERIEDGLDRISRTEVSIERIRITASASPSVRFSSNILYVAISPSRGPRGQISASAVTRALRS
jgi:hypothetical protein